MSHCRQDLIFTTIYMAYSLIFLILLIYNLWCTKGTTKGNKVLKWLNISAIMFVFCQFWSMTSHAINYAFFCVGGITNLQQMIFSAIEIFGYLGLELFFNMLMTLRLYFTFNNSAYQIKNKTLYFIITYIIILSIIHITALLMECLYFIDINPDIIMILTIIKSSLNCILEITLIIIFIYKLFLLTVSLNDNSNYNNNGIKQESLNNLDQKQLILLDTITKQSLLNILAISLQFINDIISIIQMKETALNNGIDTKYHYIAHEVRWSIVCLIILCIFMTYQFSSILYHLFCGYCHNCCYKFCWKFGYVRVNRRSKSDLLLRE